MGDLDTVKNATKRVNRAVSYVRNLTTTLEREVAEADKLESGLLEQAAAYTELANEVRVNGNIAKNLLNVLKP